MNILEYIPFGEKNAITRTQLMNATGLSDRKVRGHISEARKRAMIINTQHGSGYFRPLPTEIAAARRFLAQEESRAKSIFASLRTARAFVRENDPMRKEQVTLAEESHVR